jgi:hypothetical protein
MLHEFLVANRSELVSRCREKAAARRAPQAIRPEPAHGIALFLVQLIEMLALPAGSLGAAASRMEDSATRHGGDLRRHGYSIEQVVHEYGDLCQAVTELADEQDEPVTLHEFGSLSIRLDNAIASAVREFTREPDLTVTGEGTRGPGERPGALAVDMRDALEAAFLAVSAIKAGTAGFGGPMAAALERSLVDMRVVIDRSVVGRDRKH